MLVIRAIVRLNRTSGVARDAAVNVHHVACGGAAQTFDAATAANIGASFALMYQSFAAFLAAGLSRAANAHSVTMASVSTGGPGVLDDAVSPETQEALFGLLTPATSAQDIPPECAVALSHRGVILDVPETLGDNRPRSSRRGRAFMGPFNVSALAATGATVSGALQTDILDGFEAMQTQLHATGAWVPASYGVYSPTTDRFWTTTDIHVDNAWDTIRSRGIVSTSRSVRDITQLAPVFEIDNPAGVEWDAA